jgi:3-hydroxyisobutyrate dehydrogenase
VIFTSLPGPAQVEEVVFGAGGMLAAMPEGAVHFDLTSSARLLALRINDEMAHKGCAMLDAPVSGGPAGAATGDLVLWIGGDKAVFDDHAELLRCFSKPHHVGPIGAGTVTKLAHNMLGYTIMEAQAEAFSLAVKAGLDPLDFWEALRLGVVGKRSPLMMLTAQFLPNAYDKAAFAQKLALKDVRLALEMADELGVDMRLSKATSEDMEAVVARGEGDGDSRSFLKLQLERAGVEIDVPEDRIEAVLAALQG